ncbi:hypothetical protein TNCV_4719551 [Trichonephila clavipes]|uniref:Uncharacterized protein n=1 Tax=Trichonephila clavipes TaxID=2585209 RepID=A0A8X6W6M9_TRICX|nr:hypothetical protein TNCV_4719551 [Trichonephila clavipes]
MRTDLCGYNPRHLERAELVAHFRLTTWHDFWEYTSTGLVWLLTRSIHSAARMDGDHLLQCTGLDENPADAIVSRYWEARRQMGVG